MAFLIPKTALKEYLGVPIIAEAPNSTVDSTDFHYVHDEVRRALSWSGEGMHPEALHYLWNIVEIAVHLEEVPPERWQLLSIVRDACSNIGVIAPFSERRAWAEALAHASKLIERGTYRLSSNSRQGVVAASLRFLRSLGYEFEIDGHGARLSARAYKRICAKIDKHIALAGGRVAANLLLAGMLGTGRVIDGSLVAARTPANAHQRSEAGTPFHFLYNLSLKHLKMLTGRKDGRQQLLKAELLARHLVATLNVEPHSIFENMSLPTRFLEKVLRETAVYDELFCFAQWQPRSAKVLTGMLVGALEEAGCDFPHAPPSLWKALFESIFALAREDQLVYTSRWALASVNRVLSGQLHLADLMAAPAAKINRDYKGPLDSLKTADARFPLIAARSGEFVVQPRGIFARAFVERLFDLMRENEAKKAATLEEIKRSKSRLETRLGRALELQTANLLRSIAANVTFEGAAYHGKNKSQRLEIDIVVESETHIFLFECKKKVLTASARGGASLPLLNDLTDSFLKMQAQLARHEAKLRKDGRITFVDGSVLELKGRQVEKIAISLFDHGALQDRGLIMPLFTRLLDSTVSTNDASAMRLISTMNYQLKILTESIVTICDAQPDIARDRAVYSFGMSTWWLSVDQLHYLCGAGQGLWEGLKDLRHLSARSGDIIWERHRLKNLGPVNKALLEATQKMNNRAFI
ncbi:hypothetical protein FHT85_005327 [Rhizobium sp. BK312]|uniref:hypothetical protein n=1 Tax=Rhizobium sp. BK312 TaxID=2587080 RepID=UPI000DD815C6|nr:hypothetical protein [Rhizobium sp. BK312]MBB3428302.1 hypothetical protein [Rhizobium sp. BK312]